MAKIGNDIIDSKYEILKLLNTGGMNSAIYLALDKKLNRQWRRSKILLYNYGFCSRRES